LYLILTTIFTYNIYTDNMGNKFLKYKNPGPNSNLIQSESTIAVTKPEQGLEQNILPKLVLSKEKQYKIIFLDIDGVLNNANSVVNKLCVIEIVLKDLLIGLIQKHTTDNVQVVIVLSSTWRYAENTRIECNNYFGADSVYIIGYTPNYGTIRPYEIVTWLETNTNFGAKKSYSLVFPDEEFTDKYVDDLPIELTKLPDGLILDVESVILLDDLNYYNEIQTLVNPNKENWKRFLDECYIQIDRVVGLTEMDIQKIEELWLTVPENTV
jgi:hypothetical protein